MATCKDCVHYEVCNAIIEDFEITPTCGVLFKDKTTYIDLSNEDIGNLMLFAKRKLGEELRRTEVNQRISPNDKMLGAKYVKIKHLYTLAKELRLKAIQGVE